MQVTKHIHEIEAFKPVSLTIKFETAEELQALKDILFWDESIPELVGDGNKRKKDQCSKLMAKLSNTIL
jgi:hypothetical protein